jgi:hypothetical protein
VPLGQENKINTSDATARSDQVTITADVQRVTSDLSDRFNELKKTKRRIKVNKGKSFLNIKKGKETEPVNILEYSSSESSFDINGEITAEGKVLYIGLLGFFRRLLEALGIIDMPDKKKIFLCRHLSLAVMQGLITTEDLDQAKFKKDFEKIIKKCASLTGIASKNKTLLKYLNTKYKNFISNALIIYDISTSESILTSKALECKQKALLVAGNSIDFNREMQELDRLLELGTNLSLLSLPENKDILDLIMEEHIKENSVWIEFLKNFSETLKQHGYSEDSNKLASILELEKKYFTPEDHRMINAITNKHDKLHWLSLCEYLVNIPVADSVNANAKTSVITFSELSFPAALHHMCKLIIDSPNSNEESFMMLTHTHSMSVKIKCEADKISIMFYDPNTTNTYKMIELSSIEYVKQLSINNFMSTDHRLQYKSADESQIKNGKLNDEMSMSFVRDIRPKENKDNSPTPSAD